MGEGDGAVEDAEEQAAEKAADVDPASTEPCVTAYSIFEKEKQAEIKKDLTRKFSGETLKSEIQKELTRRWKGLTGKDHYIAEAAEQNEKAGCGQEEVTEHKKKQEAAEQEDQEDDASKKKKKKKSKTDDEGDGAVEEAEEQAAEKAADVDPASTEPCVTAYSLFEKEKQAEIKKDLGRKFNGETLKSEIRKELPRRWKGLINKDRYIAEAAKQNEKAGCGQEGVTEQEAAEQEDQEDDAP